jgi:hypothetical protein
MEANQLLQVTKSQSSTNSRNTRASWAGVVSNTRTSNLSKPPLEAAVDQEKKEDSEQDESVMKLGGRRDTIVPSSVKLVAKPVSVIKEETEK